MSEPSHCPKCQTSFQGDPIPAEYLTHGLDHDEQLVKYGRCFCRPYGDSTHFSRLMGHEVPGVYDGVLFWSCPDCGHAWPRWVDGGRLSDAGARYAAAFSTPKSAS